MPLFMDRHDVPAVTADQVAQAIKAALQKDKTIDGVITIGNQTAFDTARRLAKLEGIPGGISSGAALAASSRSVAIVPLVTSMVIPMF